ncbi:DUF4412 domain-containing protein [Ichthyenterobacterium magnum]|uniref:Uncharacterized protein DUF4412 n=1 Tax=Ichthyenterobacterium magnum TaxID=1230530 RepID=A0A420DLF6_9FLAO|nr:DUF4412 domain-containing protein [Ichthyenterobacterium magnum]RKE95038.1 uncharacterized protein DUF4412 [Ichthyenterobacterium magnum]
MKTKVILLITLCLFISISVKSQNPTKKIMEAMMGSKKLDASKLPNTYEFSWEFKTEIKSAKNETMEMNYLIGEDKDYIGMEMSGKDFKQMGEMRIVMDLKSKIMIMFMNAQDQNMAQITKLPKEKHNMAEDYGYGYKEIGTKDILGFECYGIELENANYIGTMYFTLDAPVNFSAFMAFANNKNGPKGFDPALLKVLKEEALLMEMNFKHKKKKKQSFTMHAISLNKKKTTINTKEYSNLGF